jgi:hypothetical protein
MKIHDHTDGSARCRECRGECQLPRDLYNVSAFVHHSLERLAVDGYERLPETLVLDLYELGVDPEFLWKRAWARSGQR